MPAAVLAPLAVLASLITPPLAPPKQQLSSPPRQFQFERRDLAALAAAAMLRSRPAAAEDAPLAVAYLSAGDTRLLQPAIDAIKYLGVVNTTAGSLARDGEAVPALKVEYVPQKLPFKKLLGVFWREHDPTATAEEGQFGETKDGRVPGPAVIWASDVAEQSAAERGRTLLQQSGLFRTGKEQFGDLVKPIATEVRRLDGWQWAEAPDELQGWYLSNEGAYKKLRLRRDKFLQDTFKPYKTTECRQVDESASGGPKGVICGFVIFPCSDDNGCRAVTQGAY
mmetsp:Transcript_10400/g.30807  ORF Transcript_10400/g.30807 Transcript_10400/m.30807 type:complete len:281 (-) Transcript_10400:183-1025(-)